ncbi:MAG: tyrosine-type recombinase/integrase [Atopobiaceae bacterium]|nr:tyrosine-type recombinase/integrase [Atopobiaceae bacterium]
MKRVKSRNGRTKEVAVWRGYLKYRAPNPKYVEPPAEGKDTRTQTQRRKTVWLEVTSSFDPETVRTEKQARDELTRWKALKEEEARRDSLPGANTTVGEYISSFIDDLEASQNVERRTVRDYRGIAKRIAAGFEGVVLRDLTPTMIQKWENSLTASGLAATTVIKYHRLLSEACKHAVNVDVLIKNPCQAVKTPKRQAPLPNSLTAEGYARLAATLDNMEPTPLVTAAAIAMHTGMRQGEVCGFRWRCYDPEARTIQVEESIGVAHGGTYSKAPKTKSSRRAVPVSPQLATILERRRIAMVSELQEAGITLGSEEFGKLYVVGFVDGRYRDPLRICKEWKTLSGAFGLSGTQGRAITFHDLRHSFATRAIAAGADVKAVAAVLGHTNAAITLNVYADADPESKRRASDLVSHAIAAQGEVEPFAELAEVEG